MRLRSRYTPRYLAEFLWDLLISEVLYAGAHRQLVVEFYYGDLAKGGHSESYEFTYQS